MDRYFKETEIYMRYGADENLAKTMKNVFGPLGWSPVNGNLYERIEEAEGKLWIRDIVYLMRLFNKRIKEREPKIKLRMRDTAYLTLFFGKVLKDNLKDDLYELKDNLVNKLHELKHTEIPKEDLITKLYELKDNLVNKLHELKPPTKKTKDNIQMQYLAFSMFLLGEEGPAKYFLKEARKWAPEHTEDYNLLIENSRVIREVIEKSKEVFDEIRVREGIRRFEEYLYLPEKEIIDSMRNYIFEQAHHIVDMVKSPIRKLNKFKQGSKPKRN